MTRSQAWRDYQDDMQTVERVIAERVEGEDEEDGYGYTECLVCHRTLPIIEWGAASHCPACDTSLTD